MNKNIKWPKVSIILLTYNGGDGVRKILQTIKDQDYPPNLIDVVVVDDGSKDDSVKIAKKFGARVIVNAGGYQYVNWIIGLHKIKGEFVYYVEQDIELKGKDFLKKMVKPLLEDKRLMASFTREGNPRAGQSWVTRFISYHPAQCDPLYEFLTPRVEDCIVKKKKDYFICNFVMGKIPPFARMCYRVSYLKKTPNWKTKYYFDHDFLIQTIKSGFNFFAYVPNAGIYHHHADNLIHLLRKRARNLDKHYFPYNHETEYKWLDTSNKWEVLKLAFWVIYANLFIPETVRGIYRAIINKDFVLLMQPIISISVTDVIIWKFLTNDIGRNFIKGAVTNLFKY
jgi:glycosyltransferase involved in cell wall biosynthesis